MENGKKKLKLSISGSSKKTFSSIEQAKSKSKNTVVIEKKNSKFLENLNFQDKIMIILDQIKIFKKPNNLIRPINSIIRF